MPESMDHLEQQTTIMVRAQREPEQAGQTVAMYRKEYTDQMDYAQRQVIRLQEQVAEASASAHREEYLYAESLREDATQATQELHEHARAYVRTTVGHRRAELGQNVFTYCEAFRRDLNSQAEDF